MKSSDDLPLDQFLLFLYDDIKERPTFWAKELFDWVPWSRQREILESVFKHRFTCAPTGHGIGKTDLTSILIPLWLLSHNPSFVIVNSASWPNIRARIWPALIGKLEGMEEGPIKALLTHKMPISDKNSAAWKLGNEWEAIGLSPNRPEVSQGWHSKGGTLVVVDEASSLDNEIGEALNSFIKSSNDAMLLLGNPTESEGIFADIARRRKGTEKWVVHQVSTMENPNVVATEKAIADGEITLAEAIAGAETRYEVVPGLQTLSYCHEMFDKHGRKHPITLARVFGQVPDQGEGTFISRRAVMDCALGEAPKSVNPGVVIAIDPAHSPVGDETVILVYDPVAHAVVQVEGHQGWGKEETIQRVLELDSKMSASKIVIDEIGYGFGLVEDFRDRLKMKKVEGINTAKTAHNTDAFMKLRDEAWSKTRDALTDLYIPKEFVNRFEELSELMCEYPNNRLKIEKKDDYKARTGHQSPNYADALVLCFARKPGDVAFETAGNHLSYDYTPVIEPVGGEGFLYGENMEEGSPTGTWTIRVREISTVVSPKRSGFLCRAMWYSRREQSGALWVQISEEDGVWTVFRAFKTHAATIGEFCKRVADQSEDAHQPHTYEYDILSAPAGVEKSGDFHLIHAFQEKFMEIADASHQKEMVLPQFFPPTRISGLAGLDVIDGLLQSTLARYKEDSYWAERELDPKDFMKDEMIVIKPHIVIEELAEARLRQPGATTDRREPGPEELIAGGGCFTRCLRLLAVAGAGVKR